MGLIMKIVSKSTSSKLCNPLVIASLCRNWSCYLFNNFLNKIGMITFKRRRPSLPPPSLVDSLDSASSN